MKPHTVVCAVLCLLIFVFSREVVASERCCNCTFEASGKNDDGELGDGTPFTTGIQQIVGGSYNFYILGGM